MVDVGTDRHADQVRQVLSRSPTRSTRCRPAWWQRGVVVMAVARDRLRPALRDRRCIAYGFVARVLAGPRV